MKNKKYTLIILSVFLLALLLSGCGNNEPIADKKGETLSLTYEDIKTEGREGYFVLNKDNTFSPLVNSFQGYAGEITDAKELTKSRYLWFTDEPVKISGLIPVVTKDTPLVAVYNTTTAMPETCTLEKYDYKGYTLGTHIIRNEDNSLSLITQDTMPGTTAQELLSSVADEDSYMITEINGNDVLPVNNIDNNMALILGLEKNKMYTINFFKGTEYKEAKISADTQVFQASSFVSLNNPYNKTKKGYFKINLPENLQTGYYYFTGLGMFKYQA